ncbi:hypothetical protein ILYODFUR_001929 [Ilyodon furcidens]|uniref:Uncharacterized protein n=1 Tax=Ilyodon furcidens TaxID=33524 RepID=A0ABV0UQ46_9TELE
MLMKSPVLDINMQSAGLKKHFPSVELPWLFHYGRIKTKEGLCNSTHFSLNGTKAHLKRHREVKGLHNAARAGGRSSNAIDEQIGVGVFPERNTGSLFCLV